MKGQMKRPRRTRPSPTLCNTHWLSFIITPRMIKLKLVSSISKKEFFIILFLLRPLKIQKVPRKQGDYSNRTYWIWQDEMAASWPYQLTSSLFIQETMSNFSRQPRQHLTETQWIWTARFRVFWIAQIKRTLHFLLETIKIESVDPIDLTKINSAHIQIRRG